MRINYYPASLPLEERQLFNIMLDVELEMQSWFAVAFSDTLSEEIILTLQ